MRTRTPHAATAAMRTTNIKPIARPVAVLLLQTWSTAMSQTTKSAVAIPPTALIHTCPPCHLQAARIEAGKAFGAFAAVRILRDAQRRSGARPSRPAARLQDAHRADHGRLSPLRLAPKPAALSTKHHGASSCGSRGRSVTLITGGCANLTRLATGLGSTRESDENHSTAF